MRPLLVAASVAAAFALSAPPASAWHELADCTNTFSSEDGTTYKGALAGYVVSTVDPRELVSINCVVTLDNVDGPTSGLGAGRGAAVTGDRVTFVPGNAHVQVCAVVTTAHSSVPARTCRDATLFQVVPQPVYDALDLVANEAVWLTDAVVCPILASHAGRYGPVTISADGDIYVGFKRMYDCPPYAP